MGMFDHLPGSAPSTGGGIFDHLPNAAPLAGPRTFRRDEDEDLYQQTLTRIKDERTKPRVPRSGYQEGTPEEEAVKEVQRIRGTEAEQKAFDDSRTPLKRATDASTFILSAPVRALTQGRYGLGDLAGTVSDQAGEIYSQAEQDFARANRDWLEPVAEAGQAAIAIPALQSMGAVPGQVLRQAGAAINRYTPAPVNRLLTPSPAPVATPAQAYGPAQRIADRQAFLDEGIPQFPPAFTSKGVARTARTIEEAPLVGGTVKVPKTAVEQAAAARQGQIAQGAGAAGSPEEVGRVAQGGLSRFRGSNLQDLERSRVQALGITPDRQAQLTAGNVAVNKPSQLNTAAMTDAELKAAAKSRIDLPGSTRSTIEDLTPQEVDRIVKLPARDTSFPTKASALYRQAEDAIPAMMKSNNAVNPGLIATRNAGRVAQGLLTQEKSARISTGVLQGRFGQLVQDLRNPQSNFTMDALRAARSEVGKALDNYGQFDTGLDRRQLKALYGSISDDYQSGLVAYAARARQASRLNPSDPKYVPPSVADAADKALQRYRVADRYYRQGIDRMDRFMGVLGADTMEQAARRISQYLRENTQNIGALRSITSSLRPEEARAILGNVIESLGNLSPGARQAERVFSFEKYATDWSKISQNPEVLKLFEQSLGRNVVKSLNNMGRIAERMKYYEATQNYSGSAYTAMGGLGAYAMFDPTMWPVLLASTAGTGILGKTLTSKAFGAWVNTLNRAQVQVGSSVAATKQAAKQHLRQLRQFAAKEPDPEVATAMAGLAYLIDQQLEANNPQGSR